VQIELDTGADYSYVPRKLYKRMTVASTIPVKGTQYDGSIEYTDVVILHMDLGEVFNGLVNFMITSRQSDVVILSNTFMVEHGIIFHVSKWLLKSEYNSNVLVASNADMRHRFSAIRESRLHRQQQNCSSTWNKNRALDIQIIHKSPCFLVDLGGVPTKAFFDTGADSSLITRRAFNKRNCHKILPAEPGSYLVFPFYDKRVVIEAYVMINIKIGRIYNGPARFILVDERELNSTIPDVILSCHLADKLKLIYYASRWSIGKENSQDEVRATNFHSHIV